MDRRVGRPSRKRVPLAVVEQVLSLYQEKYFDLNVRHFHEKLREQHQIGLSYTWVKKALQGAGLVRRERKRGGHRRRRGRGALAGGVLHIDGRRAPPGDLLGGFCGGHPAVYFAPTVGGEKE